MPAAFRTVPEERPDMPPGIPYIVGNEAAERFSYYGMKAILLLFLSRAVLNPDGSQGLPEAEAKFYYHLFGSAAYFFPILGALLADAFLGKYRTIILLSLVYCAGHAVLAAGNTQMGVLTGLLLIAVGSGGIKPCVGAHVGDQFGRSNQKLLTRVFQWFYFAINLGAFVSTILTPMLRESYGYHVAFGVPAVLMALATFVFWLGRNHFVHVPPGGVEFVRESLSGEGLRALGWLAMIFVFVSVFWSIFDQTGSAWVLQGTQMTTDAYLPTFRFQQFGPIWLPMFTGFQWGHVTPDQLQAANPALIMLLVPVFAYVVYPVLGRAFPLTPLRKIGIGFFVAALAFSLSGILQILLDKGAQLHIFWQLAPYFVLTCAEILVSITGLEFAYTQAPPKMKSLVMSLYLLSVSLGNLLAGAVNGAIANNASISALLAGYRYYVFFTLLMTGTAVLYVFVSQWYGGKTYTAGGNDSADGSGEEFGAGEEA